VRSVGRVVAASAHRRTIDASRVGVAKWRATGHESRADDVSPCVRSKASLMASTFRS
jgi:hypothetical protein